MKKFIFLMCILLLNSSIGFSGILFQDDFDGYSDNPDQHGWNRSHTQVTVETGSESYGGTGRCMKIEYINEGTAAYYLNPPGFDLPEAYYRFYFKRKNHTSCGGCKFFKIRAIDSDTNYANLTIQMDYGSGDIDQVDHGCGTGLIGDQGCGGRLSSSTTWNNNGTVLTTSENYTFPDEKWHCFEAYIKMNTNDNSDGAYTFWIDGVKYREVINVKMRHNLNPTGFTVLYLGSYNRFDSCPDYQYELYYDNIVISTEYIGLLYKQLTLGSGTKNLDLTGTPTKQIVFH